MARTVSEGLDEAAVTAAARQMGTALLVLDDDGIIGFANASAGQLLEADAEALVGRDVAEVLAPLEALLAQVEGGGSDGRGEVLVGRSRLLGYRLTAVAAEVGPRFAVTFQDITDVRRIRAERDRLLRLATLGDVLPTVLHELRNPIASITNSVEVALEESLDEHTQRLLHAVLSEARRISVSLEGLGVAARQLRAARNLPVDYAVREACRLMASRAKEAGLSLACGVPDLPLLPFDPAAVRAVVFNLVTNAIHACSPGDQIGVEVGFDGASQVLTLAVVDTGAVMDPQTLRRCRELFFTTKRSGSGIGLALCDRLAEEAGGRLEVESSESQGTTVRLVLPVKTSGTR